MIKISFISENYSDRTETLNNLSVNYMRTGTACRAKNCATATCSIRECTYLTMRLIIACAYVARALRKTALRILTLLEQEPRGLLRNSKIEHEQLKVDLTRNFSVF